MATRTHDAAIRALRKASRDLMKDSQRKDMHGLYRSHCLLDAAALARAAEYLDEIVGDSERAAKRRVQKP